MRGSVNATGAERQRERADEIVSARLRQRRMLLGLTLNEFAQALGLTYQQVHRYEAGINRVSAGRLYQMAALLRVDMDYFFEEATTESSAVPELLRFERAGGRRLLDLFRDFSALSEPRRVAIARLARALAGGVEDAPLAGEDSSDGRRTLFVDRPDRQPTGG